MGTHAVDIAIIMTQLCSKWVVSPSHLFMDLSRLMATTGFWAPVQIHEKSKRFKTSKFCWVSMLNVIRVIRPNSNTSPGLKCSNLSDGFMRIPKKIYIGDGHTGSS